MERVYEIGKDFRNEGVSHKHNPEFTMLEWYEAYADYHRIADELEELIETVAKEVGYEGEIDFSRPWRRVTLRDAISGGKVEQVVSVQRERAARRKRLRETAVKPQSSDAAEIPRTRRRRLCRRARF